MPDLCNMRLVFAGTPDFAACHLQALIERKAGLVGVYTQPDRPGGRGRKLTPGPVKRVAGAAGLPVFQPPSLRDSTAQQQLSDLRPDALIVVAYGLILPQAVLDIPKLGCINVHASLLPRWRGAAPIQRAIEAGDAETGISIMQMEAGLDSGPVLLTNTLPLAANMSAGDLHDRLADIGPPLLLRALSDLPALLQSARPQNDSQASYAAKIEKAEAELDWGQPAPLLQRRVLAFNPSPGAWTGCLMRQPAPLLQRQVLAFNPSPGAWTGHNKQRLKLWRARAESAKGAPGSILSAGDEGLLVACGEGSLLITELQLPGGRAMTTAEMLRARGDQFRPGTVLGF